MAICRRLVGKLRQSCEARRAAANAGRSRANMSDAPSSAASNTSSSSGIGITALHSLVIDAFESSSVAIVTWGDVSVRSDDDAAAAATTLTPTQVQSPPSIRLDGSDSDKLYTIIYSYVAGK